MKVTIFAAVFVLSTLIVNARQTVNIEKEDFVCTAGVTYKENDCNTCNCINGELGCTRKLCLPNPISCTIKIKDGTPITVDEGFAWNDACNRCWCRKEKGKVCTVKKC